MALCLPYGVVSFWHPVTQVTLWYSVFGFGIWGHPLVTKPYFWYSVFGFGIWRHSFVTQICKMEFLQQQASVRPIPEKVEVDDMTLPQHYLKGTRMCYTKIDGLQGVVVEIILGRPLFSTFLTVSPTNLLKHQSTKTNFSCRSIFPLGCLSSWATWWTDSWTNTSTWSFKSIWQPCLFWLHCELVHPCPSPCACYCRWYLRLWWWLVPVLTQFWYFIFAMTTLSNKYSFSVSLASAKSYQALLTSKWSMCGCSLPWCVPSLKYWCSGWKIKLKEILDPHKVNT